MSQSDQHKQSNQVKKTTIVLCGGGTGGHIVPLLSVARELRKQSPELNLVYIGERGGKFKHIAEESGLFDECHYVWAGKLRRYHGESFLRRITDVKTIFFNIRDMFKFGLGVMQSLFLLKRLGARVVLLKGGFVCVPVSIGAARAGSLIVTHDSDAIPSLSNRFAARYALLHATGMPSEYYAYPKDKMRYVGLPIDERFRAYSQAEINILKEKFGIPADSKVVLVTGGSQGAQRLNRWASLAMSDLIKDDPGIFAIFVTGKGNANSVQQIFEKSGAGERCIVEEFTTELFHYSAVADLVVTRAGATTLAELAAQSKACVVVPNPDLTGGHQLKNSKVFLDAEAAIVVDESSLKSSQDPLTTAIWSILNDPLKRESLGRNLHALYPDKPAAVELAKLILSLEDKPKGGL